VQAAVEALETGVVEDEATRTRCLSAIRRETRHLSRLIDDLFALSQLEAGQLDLKPETLYLEDIAQDCLTSLMPQVEQQGIALKVDLPATLPPAWADRLATRRVLANLLQNALAFTPTGGHITVHGTQVADGVRIEVSDTGPGIPSQDLKPGLDGHPRIFERFYRGDEARSGGGAGLGLAIAKELVQAQGGHIEAMSVVGEGTTIGFTLPRAE
jgi:two-component system phosphate regulon sensor histidine kinase PhoR